MYIIIFTIAIAIISGTYMVYTVYILYHIGFAKCLQYQSRKAPKMNIEISTSTYILSCQFETELSVGSQISSVWVISLILY